MVGWRRHPPRLLPRRNLAGPARLGVLPRRRGRAWAVHAAWLVRVSRLPAYAELHCLSNFSFQRGASSAQELFERAKQQGYAALAITDECTLAGIVRALEASEATGVPLIVGSEMTIEGGPKLVLLVETQAGYRRLCELITAARRRTGKGTYRLLREDFDAAPLEGLLALWVPCGETRADTEDGAWVRACFPGRTWVAVHL